MLTIICISEEDRADLEATIYPVSFITEHSNLEYFMTNKFLNRRQGIWSEFMSQFNFLNTNRPIEQWEKPVARTRRLGDLPKKRLTDTPEPKLVSWDLCSRDKFVFGFFDKRTCSKSENPTRFNERRIPNYSATKRSPDPIGWRYTKLEENDSDWLYQPQSKAPTT